MQKSSKFLKFIKEHKKSIIRSLCAIIATASVGAAGQLVTTLNENHSQLNLLQNEFKSYSIRTNSRLSNIEIKSTKFVNYLSFSHYIDRKDREYEQQQLLNQNISKSVGFLQGISKIYMETSGVCKDEN